jgi:hypothetical protein
MRRLVDPELIVDGPRSSEWVREMNNALAILNNCPELSVVAKHRVLGGSDRCVVGPSFNLLRVTG